MRTLSRVTTCCTCKTHMHMHMHMHMDMDMDMVRTTTAHVLCVPAPHRRSAPQVPGIRRMHPPPPRQIPQGGHQSVTTAVASPMVKVREHCVGDACRGIHVRCRLARRASALDGVRVRPNICYMSCTLIGEPRKPVARGSTPTDDAVWAVLIFHVIFRTLPRFGDATRDV